MIKLTVTDGQVGHGIGFERIRRITGYLVGTLERFNDAKQAELRDRVKHDTGARIATGKAKELITDTTCALENRNKYE